MTHREKERVNKTVRGGHFMLRDMKDETKKTKGREGRRHEKTGYQRYRWGSGLKETVMKGERVTERDRAERERNTCCTSIAH